MARKTYALRILEATGKKCCLLCDEKIPQGMRVLGVKFSIQFLSVLDIGKDEEAHFGCVEQFASESKAMVSKAQRS